MADEPCDDCFEMINEIIVVADGWSVGVSSNLHDHVKVSDTPGGTMGARLSEQLRASDTITGRQVVVTRERVRVRDRLGGVARRGGRIAERLKVRDGVRGAQGARLSESVRVIDSMQTGRTGRIEEVVRMLDALGLVSVGGRIRESVHVSDQARAFVEASTSETLRVLDQVRGTLRAHGATAEVLRVADALRGHSQVLGRLAEQVRVRDALRAQYHASARTEEVVYARDLLPARVGQGYAWTAPFDGWAMSRYDAYPYAGPVVPGAVAFASGHDGVYALEGGSELIEARLTSGAMDVGQGVLAHPLNAYLEYELDGLAAMAVTQTQGGQGAQTWIYPLAAEPAQVLTNGRFVFGRGLRGRHFTFELRLMARRAHINDLHVYAEETKRRI